MENNNNVEVIETVEKKGLNKNAKRGLIGLGLAALGYGAYKLIKSCFVSSDSEVDTDTTFEGIEEPIDELEANDD